MNGLSSGLTTLITDIFDPILSQVLTQRTILSQDISHVNIMEANNPTFDQNETSLIECNDVFSV